MTATNQLCSRFVVPSCSKFAQQTANSSRPKFILTSCRSNHVDFLLVLVDTTFLMHSPFYTTCSKDPGLHPQAQWAMQESPVAAAPEMLQALSSLSLALATMWGQLRRPSHSRAFGSITCSARPGPQIQDAECPS